MTTDTVQAWRQAVVVLARCLNLDPHLVVAWCLPHLGAAPPDITRQEAADLSSTCAYSPETLANAFTFSRWRCEKNC